MRKRKMLGGTSKNSPWTIKKYFHFFAHILLAGALAAALVAAHPLAAQTLSGIHIISGPTAGHISGSTVTVTWTTDKAKAGQVVWGARKGHYSGKLSETAATADHSLTITGLAKNTTYHYKVKTGSAKSADGTFTTANYSDAPFIFADMGDNRGNSSQDDSQHVTQSFQNILNAAVAKSPAFTIHVGDIFIGHSDQPTTLAMYAAFKTAVQPLADLAPFMISPGNHEMRPACASEGLPGETSCDPAFDPFALFNQELTGQPQNGPPGYVGTTFSYSFGNTHVASIDACHFDEHATTSDGDLYDLHDAVITWLDADLTAAQQAHYRHIYVFGHPEAWAPDGIRWTADTSGTQADLYAFGYRVAVGASGTILASQDGVTWTPQTSGTTATLRGVALNSLQTSPIFVAVGDSGTILTCPNAGSTWTRRTSGTTNALNATYSDGLSFVAVGSSGTILNSSDGMTWTAATSNTTQDLYGVTQGSIPGHKMWVAVGKGGTLLTSHDTTTWTAQTSGTTEDLRSVTGGSSYGSPLLVAVGNAGTILTSLDSVTWCVQSSGVSANLSAVNSTHIFVVVGEGGTVVTSLDGIEWDNQVSGTTSNLLGIEHWNPDELLSAQYTAVGVGGGILICPEWLGVDSLGGYKSQRDKLWQVLTNHKVDAYICGHVHQFDDSFTVDGVAQWLEGMSGCEGPGNGRWTLWSIDHDTVTAQSLDENGNVTYARTFHSSQP